MSAPSSDVEEEVTINHEKGMKDKSTENLEETLVSETSEVSDTDVSLNSIKGMDPEALKIFLAHKERMQQEKIRAELEKEERLQRYKLEANKQQYDYQLQLEKLKVSEETNQGHSPVEEMRYKGPKVPKLNEGDDIDAYLHTFEKLAEAYNWKQETWATRLAALLSGKALEAFARMERDDSQDYQKLKKAILRRYELTSEAYRKKFRSSRRHHDETFAEWSVRLSRYADQWWEAEDIAPTAIKSTEVKSVKDLLIREQLLESSPEDLRTWLKERKPKSVKEMVTLADQFITSRSKGSDQKSKPIVEMSSQRGFPNGKGGNPLKETRKCYNCDKRGHIASECRLEKRKPKKVGFINNRVLDPELGPYALKVK